MNSNLPVIVHVRRYGIGDPEVVALFERWLEHHGGSQDEALIDLLTGLNLLSDRLDLSECNSPVTPPSVTFMMLDHDVDDPEASLDERDYFWQQNMLGREIRDFAATHYHHGPYDEGEDV